MKMLQIALVQLHLSSLVGSGTATEPRFAVVQPLKSGASVSMYAVTKRGDLNLERRWYVHEFLQERLGKSGNLVHHLTEWDIFLNSVALSANYRYLACHYNTVLPSDKSGSLLRIYDLATGEVVVDIRAAEDYGDIIRPRWIQEDVLQYTDRHDGGLMGRGKDDFCNDVWYAVKARKQIAGPSYGYPETEIGPGPERLEAEYHKLGLLSTHAGAMFSPYSSLRSGQDGAVSPDGEIGAMLTESAGRRRMVVVSAQRQIGEFALAKSLEVTQTAIYGRCLVLAVLSGSKYHIEVRSLDHLDKMSVIPGTYLVKPIQ